MALSLGSYYSQLQVNVTHWIFLLHKNTVFYQHFICWWGNTKAHFIPTLTKFQSLNILYCIVKSLKTLSPIKWRPMLRNEDFAYKNINFIIKLNLAWTNALNRCCIITGNRYLCAELCISIIKNINKCIFR